MKWLYNLSTNPGSKFVEYPNGGHGDGHFFAAHRTFMEYARDIHMPSYSVMPMLCANCWSVTVPYLSSSYSGNAATTSAVVLPGRNFSRPAYIESYTSLYRSISFWVIFIPCAPPHLKQRTKSMK